MMNDRKAYLFERYKNAVCAAAYYTSMSQVLMRMSDEGMTIDVDKLSEYIDGQERFLKKVAAYRKALKLPDDKRAFTDTFRFQGFTVKAGFLEGSIKNVEAICGRYFKFDEPTADGCLRFEVAAIALMYAGAARVAFNELNVVVTPKKEWIGKRFVKALKGWKEKIWQN